MKTIPANSIIIYRTDSKLKQAWLVVKEFCTGRKSTTYDYTIQYIKRDCVIYNDLTDDLVVFTCTDKFTPNINVLFDIYNFRTDIVLNTIYHALPDDVSFRLLADYNEAICLINSTKDWQRNII